MDSVLLDPSQHFVLVDQSNVKLLRELSFSNESNEVGLLATLFEEKGKEMQTPMRGDVIAIRSGRVEVRERLDILSDVQGLRLMAIPDFHARWQNYSTRDLQQR